MTKIEKKCAVEKKMIFFDKNCNILRLGLHKGLPSYRRSLQPSKENIQHFKIRKLLTFLVKGIFS
jgi:hypothetical protein